MNTRKAPRMPQQGENWVCLRTSKVWPSPQAGTIYVCLYVDEGVGDTYYIMRKADDDYAHDMAITQWDIARDWKPTPR